MTCPICSAPVAVRAGGRGRQRMYCSPACRNKAYARRRVAAGHPFEVKRPRATGEGLLLRARQHAEHVAQERGWSVFLHRNVHRSLARVLDGVPEGERVSHARLRQLLSGNNLSAARTAEVLAELDLLHEDHDPGVRRWIDCRSGELPEGFRQDTRGWLLWLLDGDERTHPRAVGTLYSYFGSVRPIIERWAAQGRGHLREIAREDIAAAVDGRRGSRYSNAVSSLRSFFRFAKKHGRVFADPTRGFKVLRKEVRPLDPMTDEEIAHVEQTAVRPAARLAVALAAVHAAREEAMRGLLLEHLDFAAGTITLDGHPQRMGALTNAALRACLAERKARWPHTPNRHVLVSQQTAGTTRPVSNYFLKRQLTLHGVSLQRIRADRVLGEALATGADPLHLTVLFDLSPSTAVKYAELARRLLYDPIDEQANPRRHG